MSMANCLAWDTPARVGARSTSFGKDCRRCSASQELWATNALIKDDKQVAMAPLQAFGMCLMVGIWLRAQRPVEEQGLGTHWPVASTCPVARWPVAPQGERPDWVVGRHHLVVGEPGIDMQYRSHGVSCNGGNMCAGAFAELLQAPFVLQIHGERRGD